MSLEPWIPETCDDLEALLAEALRHALHALDLAEQSGQPAALSLAYAEVARCHRALGQAEPAEWYFQQALGWARLLGAVDTSIDLLCDLADLAVSRAAANAPYDDRRTQLAYEEARDLGFEAAELARQCADPHWEVNVLIRVSETLNLCGDHDDALELQRRALNLIVSTATSLALSDAAPVTP